MTATALFRRFLSENGLKKEFEREWAKSHTPSNRDKLKWANDFLSHYLIDSLHRDFGGYWNFLSPRAVFDWEESERGFDFWDDVNNQWETYFNSYKYKISPYIKGSYAGD